MPTPLFEKGNPGGPGRPKGSKNRLQEAFVEALADDFELNGSDAIRQCREDDASKYLNVIAKIIPRDYNITVDNLDDLTESELEERARRLAARLMGGISENVREAGIQAGKEPTH